MERFIENIDKISQHDFDNQKVFGCNYFVYYQGDQVEKCYGTISLNSDNPVTNTTIFRLASMSKPITAVAVLILVEKGLLALDDGIDKFLPQFKNIKIIDEFGNETIPAKLPTIRNILSHTSGIASCASKLDKMTQTDKATLDSSIAFHIKNGLDFEPNSRQAYSGTGAFDVLTKIIEIVSGENYLTFLKREIFQPCDMIDTTFILNDEQSQRLIDMHNKEDNQSVVYKMPDGCIFENFPATHYLGGAGLVSTLKDYCNFAKMLLNKGVAEGGRILSAESVQLLSSPQVSESIMPGDTCWGLGVRVIVDDEHPFLPKGCFGWSGAYGSHFWIDPANQLFAVYMKNSKHDGGAGNCSANNFEIAVYNSLKTKM